MLIQEEKTLGLHQTFEHLQQIKTNSTDTSAKDPCRKPMIYIMNLKSLSHLPKNCFYLLQWKKITLVRAFNFWLALSQILLESIVIPIIKLNIFQIQLLSILAIALTFLETRRWLLWVFTFMQLLLSHLKRIDNKCSKLLTTNSIFLFTLYGVESST